MKQSTFISKLLMLGWSKTRAELNVLIPSKQFKPGFIIGINTENKTAGFMRVIIPTNENLHSKLLHKPRSFKKTLKLILKYTE